MLIHLEPGGGGWGGVYNKAAWPRIVVNISATPMYVDITR